MNHFQIFPLVGIPVSTYPYYDPQTIGLAFNPFIETLKNAAPRSVFLIHACAHNPTGVDPTREQWGQIAEVMLEKGHFAFFDCAYQGFASGDLDNDAWAVREFVRRNVPLLVCQVRHLIVKTLIPAAALSPKADMDPLGPHPRQSFAKNAGLYGERVGALHVVSPSKEGAARIKSQLSVLARSEISNPPAHGARLVSFAFSPRYGCDLPPAVSPCLRL